MWLVWQTFSRGPERVINQGLVSVPDEIARRGIVLWSPESCGLEFLLRLSPTGASRRFLDHWCSVT